MIGGINLFGPIILSLTIYGFAFFLYSVICKSLERSRINKEKELEEWHCKIKRSASGTSSENTSEPVQEGKILKEIKASQIEFDHILERAEKKKETDSVMASLFAVTISVFHIHTERHK